MKIYVRAKINYTPLSEKKNKKKNMSLLDESIIQLELEHLLSYRYYKTSNNSYII